MYLIKFQQQKEDFYKEKNNLQTGKAYLVNHHFMSILIKNFNEKDKKKLLKKYPL